jgi:hypothetical protein
MPQERPKSTGKTSQVPADNPSTLLGLPKLGDYLLLAAVIAYVFVAPFSKVCICTS